MHLQTWADAHMSETLVEAWKVDHHVSRLMAFPNLAYSSTFSCSIS